MDEDQSLRQLSQLPPSSFRWTVSLHDGLSRLDTFLSARLPTLARREVLAWIENGNVRVNDRLQKKGDRLHPGDVVSVHNPPTLQATHNLSIPIIFVDADLVVIDKPAGTASVALRHTNRGTVANFLLGHFPEMRTASPHPLEMGVVHRLDTATSGVLLAARSPSVYSQLRRQFARHAVNKRYVALVTGRVRKSGERVSWLAPCGRRGHVMQETSKGDGQEAQTSYYPIDYCGNFTLVEVTIQTGVRHQIRAHLAALGHPIVGDSLYGGVGAERLCLHASSLTFRHPRTSRWVSFISTLPKDYRAIVGGLRSSSS